MPLTLEIVTPEQRALTVQCDEVRLTGVAGGFGIRPGHTPLVATLAPGELAYDAAGSTHRYAAGEGFAEVSDDRVRVLVEEVLRADQLDPQRTERELAEARKKLEILGPDDPDYDKARAWVEHAAARALVASHRP
ncbi:MAG TPA: ATP synthase F1 subunit epsilon [Myxococcales bacterium]|jgi:F-type H+-transporting ATPase subunit epsilon|nr:ATP synthase F1 subunit epsilon [Myxococcales bacterium]